MKFVGSDHGSGVAALDFPLLRPEIFLALPTVIREQACDGLQSDIDQSYRRGGDIGRRNGCADAADLPLLADAVVVPPVGSSWEIRAGVAAHGVGSHEHNTVDLMGEVLTPCLPFFQDMVVQFLMPRVHGGGSVNLSGRTSFGYAGFAWTWPIYRGAFVEPFIGAAVHNGSIAGIADDVGVGCDYLFHVGGSVGYRFDQHWSALVTFEHLSNGKQLFGVNCGSNQNLAGSNGNQGSNNYAVKIGYAF